MKYYIVDAFTNHPFGGNTAGVVLLESDTFPTGTANAALTHYLAHNGIIGSGCHSFLQGETMGRPSIVKTRLEPDGTIRVGGPAAIVAEGWLKV